MKALLIRHPQTEWNRAGIIQGQLDSPLTPRGREESLALIRGLRDAGIHPDVVFSSPLGRAQQMALLIAEQYHCDIRLDEALQEQDFGEFDGRLLSDIRREYPRFGDDEGFQPPQGESPGQAAQRLLDFLHHLPDICPHHTVALVSHGQIMQAVIAQLLENSLENVARYHHPNASYSLLEINDDTCRVARWGVASHLLGLKNG
ncbi:histidine phosphatase family protein [Kosakonia sacchari]|uniref:histidine phosphatase family protein n=1 Tax=Kosakonia sacchari TaxID=1158459 RepID=UPI0015857350|nr:histidine phosphatase family protein [Kosakonia sacchari]NUL37995.1 histidine phosphatase family protein [Kosakonia sacchari]